MPIPGSQDPQNEGATPLPLSQDVLTPPPFKGDVRPRPGGGGGVIQVRHLRLLTPRPLSPSPLPSPHTLCHPRAPTIGNPEAAGREGPRTRAAVLSGLRGEDSGARTHLRREPPRGSTPRTLWAEGGRSGGQEGGAGHRGPHPRASTGQSRGTSQSRLSVGNQVSPICPHRLARAAPHGASQTEEPEGGENARQQGDGSPALMPLAQWKGRF